MDSNNQALVVPPTFKEPHITIASDLVRRVTEILGSPDLIVETTAATKKWGSFDESVVFLTPDKNLKISVELSTRIP